MNKTIPTHAVKAVVRNQNHEVLFLQRNPATGAQPNWDLPGGLVEAGEDDATALVREIQEELGVGSTIGDKLGEWSFFRPFDGSTVQVTNYEATLDSTDIELSDEHVDSQYVPTNRLGEIAVKDPSIWSALGSA